MVEGSKTAELPPPSARRGVRYRAENSFISNTVSRATEIGKLLPRPPKTHQKSIEKSTPNRSMRQICFCNSFHRKPCFKSPQGSRFDSESIQKKRIGNEPQQHTRNFKSRNPTKTLQMETRYCPSSGRPAASMVPNGVPKVPKWCQARA